MNAIQIKTAEQVVPQCYAYTTPGQPEHDGWTKIGFTELDVDTRIKQQAHTVDAQTHKEWALRAAFMSEPYGTFTDRDFHAYLKKLGVERKPGTEWFRVAPDEAKRRFYEFVDNHGLLAAGEAPEPVPYTLRDEQEEAVQAAAAYFGAHKNGEFLWNAKPRFGKTLAAYDLCMNLNAHNILIVTNRPAIANSWYNDYMAFFGPQSGYVFVSTVDGIKDKPFVRSREQYAADHSENKKGCIEFVSLQDMKGSKHLSATGRYDKLAELSAKKGVRWDVMIVDEAHEGVDTFKTDTAFNQIRRKFTLHLSGTPFKAIANEKFPQSAIFNWTYADEQERKRDWDVSREEENPYAVLPRLSLFTYQMSDIVRDKAKRGIRLDDGDVENYAFDLNEFFAVDDKGKFVHDKDVDAFLDALTRGEKFPFSTPELRSELKHTFWLLNRVASAKALAEKLHYHPVFKDYEVVLAAGDGRLDSRADGGGDDADAYDDAANKKSFDKVKQAIATHDKTITLSVGQLTTGVTIPEWTAVLMLSNMSSPSLYVQAAFRAQNPCLFTVKGSTTLRKTNAYVFDFDPARTLTIFETFANGLYPETAAHKDPDVCKKNVRELLNFFPVYGEDDDGAMIELDVEKVLTIPRRIHAREVVERGFMSNFLFANIGVIFAAPREIINIISRMQALEEPKRLVPVGIDGDTAERLHLNENGDVDLPREFVVGTANDVFGEKIYADISGGMAEAVEKIQNSPAPRDSQKDELQTLREVFAKPIADPLLAGARTRYGDDLKKSTQKQVEHKIRQITDSVVDREYGDYTIRHNQMEQEWQNRVAEAQKANAPMHEITKINNDYETEQEQSRRSMIAAINAAVSSAETVQKAKEAVIETVETERRKAEKEDIEGNVRDHLRGFSRTIPAFLMAYGDETTTLANFDKLVPADVFWEVTANPQTGEGVTLDQFRLLRDGGDYTAESGETRHFEGHLFDQVVFDDAVQEFMRRRKALANYFEPEHTGDIFDYIPPQRTNQIFTPRAVVKDMVDRLEQENPGCFDDPEATFADLYMKSGMYIAEIVARLFRSEGLGAEFPDGAERLRHIFAKQVYGCAPTEIIYRICKRYLLGFDDTIRIEKHHICRCDTLELAKNKTLAEELPKVFGE